MYWLNSLMASLHHLAAFTLTACLVYEWISFQATMPATVARRIQRVDLWYGISAAVMYGQMTTGEPATIIYKHAGGKAVRMRLGCA